jgi:hypothetical protein
MRAFAVFTVLTVVGSFGLPTVQTQTPPGSSSGNERSSGGSAGRQRGSVQPAAGPASPPTALRDLGALFREGPLLADENDDDVIDAIKARFVLPARSVPEDVAAAANLAARLGFESSAFTPGLASLDREILDPGAIGGTTSVLVGRTNAHVQALAADPRVRLGDLVAGQGVVALTRGAGATSIVVAGADDAGTAAAGAAASSRLPYLWQLRGDTIDKVRDDVQAVLVGAGAKVTRLEALRAVYQRDKERMVRLTIEAGVAAGSDGAVKALEAIARAHAIGQAQFGQREADQLNYYGLDTLEVKLGAATVRIDRFGPPYRSDYPSNPWKATPKALSLSSIFTREGLFSDSRGQDLIPDESETLLVVGQDAGSAIAAVDLAARIGIETTGLTLPLARTERELKSLADVPNPILVGPGPLAATLAGGRSLAAGEGEVRIVPAAFGPFPAIVIRGADAAGVNAAASYLARGVPFVATPRRGEPSLEDLEDDVRGFFRARSDAGQAAAALDAIDAALPAIEQAGAATVDAKIYLEEGSEPASRFVQ